MFSLIFSLRRFEMISVECVDEGYKILPSTYLDGLHGTDHQDSFHHPGTEATQQASGAVQSTRLILGMVAEELKHTKPGAGESRTEK